MLAQIRMGDRTPRAKAESAENAPRLVRRERDYRWWQEQLEDLIRGLEALQDPDKGLIAGSHPEKGQGIRRRLDLALEVEERTSTGEEARLLWDEAITEIALGDEYGELEIEKQMGLLPLGPDPDSGLWEFWHVQSGEKPERDPDTDELKITAETGIVLVLIPGGMFLMGAQKDDPDKPNFDANAAENESPVHAVTLSPFFLSKYEMTQAQWQRVMGVNPSHYLSSHHFVGAQGPRHPVEDVGWEECRKALNRLGLVLPTEAQWEYAARGGTDTPWWCGEQARTIGEKRAGNLMDIYAISAANHPGSTRYESWNDGAAIHAPVGSYAANSFGLHDVIGNVSEWCRDCYGETDEHRIYRGGSFNHTAKRARSAYRAYRAHDSPNPILGLRPARILDQ
jgi:formylglycine-generating enzyme required for sulfatase activity